MADSNEAPLVSRRLAPDIRRLRRLASGAGLVGGAGGLQFGQLSLEDAVLLDESVHRGFEFLDGGCAPRSRAATSSCALSCHASPSMSVWLKGELAHATRPPVRDAFGGDARFVH